MRCAALLCGLALIGAALAPSPAGGTFPGANGPIAYRVIDLETGFGQPLLRALPDGTQVTPIDPGPGSFSDWRADGRRIAFDVFQPDGDVQIATMRPDGGDKRTLTSGPGIHEAPSWSPSGRRIVYDYSPEADPSTPGFHTRLWTMRPDGRGARPLPMRRPGFDVEPRYSPDGRWIAFLRNRPPTARRQPQVALMRVGARGGRVHRLTPWVDYPERPGPQDRYFEHPTWSPDSRWILFDLGPNGTIQAMRPDGRERHTILAATAGFGGHKPWYSPDGTRILFVCERQGTLPEPPPGQNDDICVMDADGTDVVNLTNTTDAWENYPSWAPSA